MEPQKPFTVSARAYDIIYEDILDYDTLVGDIAERLARLAPDARTLLEVGCGTGLWLQRVADRYEVVGVDISADMLAVARERLPGVELVCADMRDMDLGRRFDVVACMFSSIGYMETAADLAAAYAAFARHLGPGGVLIVEPWFTPEAWRTDGHLAVGTYRGDGGVVTRMNRSEVEGSVSIMDMHHLAAFDDEPVVHFVERHRMGLFTVAEHLAALREAGLEAEHDPGGPLGRGLYVASLR